MQSRAHGTETAGEPPLRKAVVAAAIGNGVEWFDFAVYGFLATYIGLNFFPNEDPTVSLLSTFAVFATGRAWEQARMSIGYTKLNVKIAATHAGITVGEDGASRARRIVAPCPCRRTSAVARSPLRCAASLQPSATPGSSPMMPTSRCTATLTRRFAMSPRSGWPPRP